MRVPQLLPGREPVTALLINSFINTIPLTHSRGREPACKWRVLADRAVSEERTPRQTTTETTYPPAITDETLYRNRGKGVVRSRCADGNASHALKTLRLPINSAAAKLAGGLGHRSFRVAFGSVPTVIETLPTTLPVAKRKSERKTPITRTQTEAQAARQRAGPDGRRVGRRGVGVGESDAVRRHRKAPPRS